MDKDMLKLIDSEIEGSYRELTELTKRFVNIKSVKDEPVPGGPFGAGVKQVLDTVLELAGQEGFYCTDYKLGVISAALKEGQPDLGIWLHGDVVPEGDGWKYPPYNATEYDGCVIGRGATDNKGQLAAMFLLLKIFKKLGIELSYNPAIYVGSNEEAGMTDLVGDPEIPEAKGFLNCCTPPKLSLVPDSGFPVGYGGKGSMMITLKSQTPLHGVCLWAGREDSPARATAVFADRELPQTLPECTVDVAAKTVYAESPPRHGARPDPNGNMITKLCSALLEQDLVAQEDRYIYELFKDISLDIHGKKLDVAIESESTGCLTVFTKEILEIDGCPAITLNIRYPIGITYSEICRRIGEAAGKRGFVVAWSKEGTPPYLLDPNKPVVQTLTAIANEQMGKNAPAYTLLGGTYAHRLPNAYPYGAAAGKRPHDFPEGRGNAHGIDESVGIELLQRAMRIYARALLALQDIPWN